MSGVRIVTIKEKIPLYKKEEPATNIELITFEETGFQVVSQKDLYQVGDFAVYCIPDYNIPDIPVFDSYYRPFGESSKSKLGKNGRIRACKFNFHTGNGKSIYSEGILLRFKEVEDYLGKPCSQMDEDVLELELGITKYERELYERSKIGSKQGNKGLPQGLYKTDETNVNSCWKVIKFPVFLQGKMKIDGSSISLFYRNGEFGICSRNFQKSLTIKTVVGRKKGLFNWLKNKLGFDINIYEIVENPDAFVKVGKPYLDRLVEYCEITEQNLAIRGEIVGSASKGSGNSKNPHGNVTDMIYFYDIDRYDEKAEPVDIQEFKHYLQMLSAYKLEFKPCETLFERVFESREALVNTCEEIFNNRIMEGIVCRTEDRQQSFKVMSLQYDSNK